MIEDFNGGLSYGKYFRRYKTVDGHIITVEHLPFLDTGTIAENARSNGMIHPRNWSGLLHLTNALCLTSLLIEGNP